MKPVNQIRAPTLMATQHRHQAQFLPDSAMRIHVQDRANAPCSLYAAFLSMQLVSIMALITNCYETDGTLIRRTIELPYIN